MKSKSLPALGLLLAPLVVLAAGRPNFVFFLTDDQPYDAMSCAGNPGLSTPNMDRLAAEGVLFKNAFVTTSICSSSRASIYTGQHMRRHQIDDFKKPISAEQWPETFPAQLRSAGYRTAFLGKFAIGMSPSPNHLVLPADKFDLWYGFQQNIAFKQTIDGKPRYLTTVMTEKAVDFIKQTNTSRPFCLIMAFKEPHGPRNYFDPDFKAPATMSGIPRPDNFTRESFGKLPEIVRRGLNVNANWFEKPGTFEHDMRAQYALIERADLAIGQICRALQEQGLDDNTVIIHMSDNGWMDGAHGLESKWLMYEESIRVPLIIRDPRLPDSTQGVRTQMALNIDIAPTILAMAGVGVPPRMQGEDLRPILLDAGAKGREDWYYEHVFTPDYKSLPIPKSEGVRSTRWKYIRYTETDPPVEQLFDLAADPREENDLAGDAAHADKLAELRTRCDEYRRSLR